MFNAVLLKDTPHLPPKPPAEPGRAVLWVYVLGEPGFVYRDMDYLVNAEVIDQHVHRFNLLCGRGYRPPLAIEHPEDIHDLTTLSALRDLPEGMRAGDILELRRHRLGGRECLIAAVSPAMPEAAVAEAVRLGQLRYFSPGLGPVQTDEGDVLALVLKELSIVTAPHQKTAPTHVLGQEQGGPMDPEKENAAPDYKAMMAALMDMTKRMEAMEARVQAMEKPAEEPAPPAEEPVNMSESEAVVALRAQVAALQEQNFLATVPQTITLTLGDKDRDLIAQLHRVSPDLAKRLVAKARPATAPAAPIGNEGAGAQPSTPEALYQACLAESKGDMVQANTLYTARRRAQLGA